MLGLPETKLGMLPAAGGTQSLTRAIGPHAAAPIVLTGRNLDADEALRRGIVHEVVADEGLTERVDELAAELSALEPAVVAAAKRALSAAWDQPLHQGLSTERRLARLASLPR